MPGVAWELLLQLALGVALAAAAGLRIFLPFLVVSLAGVAGWVELEGGLAWLGTRPALMVFGVATAVEVAAYYVPWVDNALDWLGAPLAVIAGTLLVASAFADADPLLRWGLAVVAGGGTAGAVHGGLALLRKLSSLTTGGLANPILATAEAGGALALTLLALVLPLLALFLVAVVLAWAWRAGRHRRARLEVAP